MKTLFLSALFAAFSPAAFAQQELDQFQVLEQAFAQGTVADQAQVMGWTSGRCYHAAAHSTPEGSLLAGLMDKIHQNEGPLFPGEDVFKFVFFLPSTSNPAEYDQLTPRDEEEIQNALKPGSLDDYSAATASNGSLLVTIADTDRYELRQAQGVLVLKYSTKPKPKQVYEVEAYCNYFLKVR